MIFNFPVNFNEEKGSMMRTFNRERSLRTTVAGVLIGLVMMAAITVAPSAQAAGAKRSVATPVTTTAISFRLDAQVIHGAAVHGWLSGSMDSTGVLTATLTAAGLPPLQAGCAPHVEFGPACGLPASANVTGHVIGSGPSSSATLVAVGNGWTWILAGSAVGSAGQWAGTLTQGTTYAGTWSLTPQTTTVNIYMGGRSDAKSKDKLIITAAISLHVTADGWAIGTYSPLNGSFPSIVQGYVNPNKASVSLSIPMGAKGYVLATGWSRQGFNNLNWTGSMVGPATGDYGTWSGQG